MNMFPYRTDPQGVVSGCEEIITKSTSMKVPKTSPLKAYQT